MATFLIAFSVVMLVGLSVKLLQNRKNPARPDDESRNDRFAGLDTVAAWPAQATLILTLPERRAHQLLSRALPDHIVLAQVPLSRFLRIPTRNSYHEWMRRVGRLCCDLVVCRTSSQVVAVVNIRLTGKESERGHRRNERIERVVSRAGIRALVWEEDALPPIGHVRELVLGSSAPPVPTTSAKPTVDALPAVPSAPPIASPAVDLEESEDEAELLQPTPDTSFDDFDSGPTPLSPRDKA